MLARIPMLPLAAQGVLDVCTQCRGIDVAEALVCDADGLTSEFVPDRASAAARRSSTRRSSRCTSSASTATASLNISRSGGVVGSGGSFGTGLGSSSGCGRRRRAKDAKDPWKEVRVERLEELIHDLFGHHDLGGDGFLDESELVRLNECIAILHHGDDVDTREVRLRYKDVYRTKFDPMGRPVPYEIFRGYALEVLNGLDKDMEAQEMILEQWCAEALSGRMIAATRSCQAGEIELETPTTSVTDSGGVDTSGTDVGGTDTGTGGTDNGVDTGQDTDTDTSTGRTEVSLNEQHLEMPNVSTPLKSSQSHDAPGKYLQAQSEDAELTFHPLLPWDALDEASPFENAVLGEDGL